MANSKSAWKRVRQNQKNRDHNVSLRSMIVPHKKVLKLVVLGDKDKAKEAFKTVKKLLMAFQIRLNLKIKLLGKKVVYHKSKRYQK